MIKEFFVCPESGNPIVRRKFIVCPHCGEPITEEGNIQQCINSGTKYCGNCGKEIASALAGAPKEIVVKVNADASDLDMTIEKAKQLVSLLQEVKDLAASLHIGLSLTT